MLRLAQITRLVLVLVLTAGVAVRADGDRLAQGRGALADGKPDEAAEIFRELIAADPQDVAPYQGLAEAFAAQGRPDEAVRLVVQVARKLIPSGRYEEAVGPLELAAALDPEAAEVHALLGRALAEQRLYPSAIASYERALELGEDGLGTLLKLASCYWESERYDDAERTYRQALTRHGDPLAAYQLGQFLLWQGRAAEALPLLEQAAEARPDNARVRDFLERAREAARTTLPATPSSGSESESDQGTVVLTPVAEATGIRFRHEPGVTPRRHLPETMGSGLAWLDADGDGWWDLYLVSSAGDDRLYRNRGDGTFEVRATPDVNGYGQGVVAADVDDDDDTDLYLTRNGPDVLLVNRGDGTFVDGTAAGGLGADGWSSSAAFADADGDGDLDLYVSRYVVYDPEHGNTCGFFDTPDYCNVLLFDGVTDLFYRNDGGSFREETAAAGLAQGRGKGRGLGVVWTDLDGDLLPDLYVANDVDPNALYRNLGGTFEDVGLLSGAALNQAGEGEAGMGVAAGDLDGDGRPELVVTNFDVETNTVYRNLGGMAFEDVSAASGFALPSFNRLGFGVVLADFDLDGDLDVYVANGHVFERPRRETVTHAQADLLLLGDGRGGFSAGPAQALTGIGRGAAAADFDNDGDPDVAVQDNRGPAKLLRNDTPRRGGNGWLGVELHGAGDNTQAVGARIVLARQTRQVLAGQSYQSSADRRVLFAWPDGPAETLEVTWPSGRRVVLRHPPVGRYLHLREPAPWTKVP